MPRDIDYLEQLEQTATEQLDPASDSYDEDLSRLGRLSSVIDQHYKELRQVDDNGKVTKETGSRQPARVGEGDYDYFFEPNVREVQAFFRRDPGALDRLRDSRGEPLRPWSEGIAQEEIRSPIYDAQANAMGPVGYNVQPAKTHLDQLTEDQEPYSLAADEMYRLASEDATRKGKGLKRYRDIKLEPNEWKDLIAGGVKKGVTRGVAPATLGVADAMSAGQASPALDAANDLMEYKNSRLTPEEKESARFWGYEPDNFEKMAPSEDIKNRSMPSYVLGNVAGYAMPGNPANITARVINEAAGYGARGVGGRLFTSALAGGVSNAEESAFRDMARYANEGQPIPVGDVALNALVNGGVGAVSSGAFDLAGQGIGGLREGFRRFDRNAPLRTLEQAGGRADVLTGVAAPEEIRQAYERMHTADPNRPPVTAAGEMSGDLAPSIEQSAKKRALDERARTEAQMEEYYQHPAYRDRRVSPRPAVEGLIDLAKSRMSRGSASGERVAMDPAIVDEVGGVLRDYANANGVPRADAPSVAHTAKGTVVDGALANRLFGYKEGDVGYIRPGFDAVVVPKADINAQDLTALEGRIDRELNFASAKNNPDDPVWNRFNERVKELRDQFPLYQDAEGNLVAPPDDTPQSPFDLADDIPRGPGQGTYLSPPMDVGGQTPPKPEGLMGIGGTNPIPDNPFEPRLPAGRGLLNPAITPNRQVTFEGSPSEPPYIPAEALPGVGPKYNPRDVGEALPVQGQFDVGEAAPPPMVRQPDIRGVGPNFSPRSNGAAMEPQPTRGVGTYNEPATVLPGADTPPKTDRNPYGFAGKNPVAVNSQNAEMLDQLAGNKLAMPIEPRADQNITPEERALQQHDIDEFLRKDAEMNAPEPKGPTGATGSTGAAGPDERGGLERMLDAQLEQAPKVPTQEIEEIGALQTADREQVARDQKAYVEDLFAPGREARAAQVDKIRTLADNPEVVEEAIAQVKEIDRRLGGPDGIPREQKIQMVVHAIEKKLGRKIDPEDLIRFGLISAGLVTLSKEEESPGSAKEAGMGLGSLLLALGLRGRGGKGNEPEAPKGKPRPTQPEEKLDDDRVVRGFSAMRRRQHTRQEAIEKAMKRLGVEGDTTLEARIRNYGQGTNESKIDEALFNEAKGIDEAAIKKGEKSDRLGELRRAAGANAYPGLVARAWPSGSSRTLGNAVIDMFFTRGYRVGEFMSGRFNRQYERNPFVRGNDTTGSEMQRMLLQDPARRLLNLTGGGPTPRLIGNAAWNAYQESRPKRESAEEYEKRKKTQPSP